MSEYNDDIPQDECCGESIHGDIFDDLNHIDDSEVLNLHLKIILFCFLFFVIRKIIVLLLLVYVHNGKKSKQNQWKKFYIV